jgi:hypothetical protein
MDKVAKVLLFPIRARNRAVSALEAEIGDDSESPELIAWRQGLIAPNNACKARWDWVGFPGQD